MTRFLLAAILAVVTSTSATAQVVGESIPRTPVATQVVTDAECSRISELNVIYFSEGSAEISSEARARLGENIIILRNCPQTFVVVQGTAAEDEVGSSIANARAQAVAQYYRRHGVENCFAPLLTGGPSWLTPGSKTRDAESAGNRARDRATYSVPFQCEGPACEPETVVVRDTVTVPGRERIIEIPVERVRIVRERVPIRFTLGAFTSSAFGSSYGWDTLGLQAGTCDGSYTTLPNSPDLCNTDRVKSLVAYGGSLGVTAELRPQFHVGVTVDVGVLQTRSVREQFDRAHLLYGGSVLVGYELPLGPIGLLPHVRGGYAGSSATNGAHGPTGFTAGLGLNLVF